MMIFIFCSINGYHIYDLYMNHPNVFGRETVPLGFCMCLSNVLGQAELTDWGKAIVKLWDGIAVVPLAENSWIELLAWQDGL